MNKYKYKVTRHKTLAPHIVCKVQFDHVVLYTGQKVEIKTQAELIGAVGTDIYYLLDNSIYKDDQKVFDDGDDYAIKSSAIYGKKLYVLYYGTLHIIDTITGAIATMRFNSGIKYYNEHIVYTYDKTVYYTDSGLAKDNVDLLDFDRITYITRTGCVYDTSHKPIWRINIHHYYDVKIVNADTIIAIDYHRNLTVFQPNKTPRIVATDIRHVMYCDGVHIVVSKSRLAYCYPVFDSKLERTTTFYNLNHPTFRPDLLWNKHKGRTTIHDYYGNLLYTTDATIVLLYHMPISTRESVKMAKILAKYVPSCIAGSNGVLQTIASYF